MRSAALFSLVRSAGSGAVVSFTAPHKVAAYLERNPLPFPAVADPELKAYQEFGLQRTTWGGIFRLRVIGRFLKLILRGWLPRKPGEGEDPFQLGGDFLIDAQGRLVFAHPSTEPTDRPSKEELRAALEQLAPHP